MTKGGPITGPPLVWAVAQGDHRYGHDDHAFKERRNEHQLVTVDFRGDTLFAVEEPDGVLVAVKPICDRLIKVSYLSAAP